MNHQAARRWDKDRDDPMMWCNRLKLVRPCQVRLTSKYGRGQDCTRLDKGFAASQIREHFVPREQRGSDFETYDDGY